MIMLIKTIFATLGFAVFVPAFGQSASDVTNFINQMQGQLKKENDPNRSLCWRLEGRDWLRDSILYAADDNEAACKKKDQCAIGGSGCYKWGTQAQIQNIQVPAGTYQKTCKNYALRGATLTADCMNGRGIPPTFIQAFVDLPKPAAVGVKLTTDIVNCNGVLKLGKC